MYKLTEAASYSELSQQQKSSIKKTEEYLQSANLAPLLNEALAMLIEQRPQDIRQGLAKIFRKIKQKEKFFKKVDFEAIYESYDFFGKGNFVTYYHLLKALQGLSIKCSKEDFLQKYPQFKVDKYINKFDFVKIAQVYYQENTRPQEEQWTPIPIVNKPKPKYRGFTNRIMYKDVGFDKFVNPIKNYFKQKYNLLQNIAMFSKKDVRLTQDHQFIKLMTIIKQDNFTLNNSIQIASNIFQIFKKNSQAFHIMASLFCQYFWVQKFKQKKNIEQIQSNLSIIIKKLCKAFPPTVQGQQSVKQDVPFPTVPQRNINLFGQNDGTYFASYQTLLFHMQLVNQDAEQSYPHFKQLVEKIGQENDGFHYKTGLKLPKNTYDWFKVLIRVMEKMFPEIKQRKNQIILDAQTKLQAQGRANMQTVMSTILQTWIAQINDILVHRGGKAQYYITDLVRGKCMFKNLLAIKKAVNAVIRLCAAKEYEIVQLDNRLKKVTQDIVFKILIGKIVCEFQLALQFQSTQFQFGHCFYEIDRSPLGAIFGSYLFLGKEVMYHFLGQVRDTLAMYSDQQYSKYVKRDEKTIQTLTFILSQFTQSNK